MSNGNEFSVGRTDDDLVALWRGNGTAAPDAERVAREIMARVWRFDQQILWRNFREYAAGLVLMVIFAMQMVLGSDRTGGAIGFACVSFVMVYLWWRHRGLEPLDPAADLAAYRRALIRGSTTRSDCCAPRRTGTCCLCSCRDCGWPSRSGLTPDGWC